LTAAILELQSQKKTTGFGERSSTTYKYYSSKEEMKSEIERLAKSGGAVCLLCCKLFPRLL